VTKQRRNIVSDHVGNSLLKNESHVWFSN